MSKWVTNVVSCFVKKMIRVSLILRYRDWSRLRLHSVAPVVALAWLKLSSWLQPLCCYQYSLPLVSVKQDQQDWFWLQIGEIVQERFLPSFLSAASFCALASNCAQKLLVTGQVIAGRGLPSSGRRVTRLPISPSAWRLLPCPAIAMFFCFATPTTSPLPNDKKKI